MHGLSKGSNVAVKPQNTVFKNLDFVAGCFAKSDRDTKLFANGNKGKVLFGACCGYTDELVGLGLLGNKGRSFN